MSLRRLVSSLGLLLCLSIFGAGESAIAGSLVLSPETIGKTAIHVAPDILSDKASERAVRTLASSLGTVFGSEPLVKSDGSGAVEGIVIQLASEDKSGAAGELQGKGPNAFLLKTDAGLLRIIGNSQVAVQNGIYSVLNDMGCRWYFPGDDWAYLPKLGRYEIDDNRVEEPSFRICRLFPGIGQPGTMDVWSARNRMNRYDKGYVHHTPGLDPKLFSTRPELFALRNGERVRRQICIGNPEARKLVAENAIAYLRDRPGTTLVSVEPPDNLAHCQDPATLAIGNGSPSDAVFFLANETAKEVRKVFPKANVGLYAYLAHANPPSFNLESNVYVEITTNLRQTDLSIPDSIKAFRERGAQVGIRDYLSIPQWHSGRIGGGSKGANFVDTPKEIAAWGDFGVVGYSAEMSENWAVNGLTYFLISRVLWNRGADLEKEKELFFKNMFEEAAPVVSGMYERWRRRGLTRGEVVADSIVRLEEARKRTSDPAVQTRLAQLGMAVYWNYLFSQLQREITETPDDVSTEDAGALRQLVRWGARIEPVRMIDTYAISRVFTRINVFKKLDSLSARLGAPMNTFVNGLNGTWWKADRQLGVPTNDEVWQRLAEAGKALAADQVSRAIGRDDIPKQLVPANSAGAVRSVGGGDESAAGVRWLSVPKGIPVVFWAKAGEKVKLPIATVAAALKSPIEVRYQITAYGASEQKLSEGKVMVSKERGVWRGEATEADLPVIEFQAPEERAYVLDMDSIAGTLGLLLSNDLKERPIALALCLDDEGHEYAERFISAQKEGTAFYAYWPKSVDEAVVVGNRGTGPMKIEVGSESLLDEGNFSSEEIQPIKAGGRSGIMKISSSDVSFAIRGVPLFLSPTPGQVLMPGS